ncbi:MAG: nuclear transport factor 2 family protein [Pseudomonadota bacterium]
MQEPADTDDKAIEVIVEDYFLGMYEADTERLQRIFHPQCWLFGENPRGSHAFPVKGFIEQIGSSPAPKVEGEPYDMHLVSVDRTGPVAVAKVNVRYQNRHFTDYLVMQRTGDEWRIVNKAFFSPD